MRFAIIKDDIDAHRFGLPNPRYDETNGSQSSICCQREGPLELWQWHRRPGASRAGLITDANGNLYGTTDGGGAYYTGTYGGFGGTAFELTRPSAVGGNWTESILWNFGKGADGQGFDAGLILDKNGNLYGTTSTVGTVFELEPPSTAGGIWTESILWTFDGGDFPLGGVIMDASGNLYGTIATSEGAVFELTPPSMVGGSWNETILAPLDDLPEAGLIMDANGNLYGTTQFSVFELSPPSTSGGNWIESTLWTFGKSSDGAYVYSGLIMDKSGNLYGTTEAGGANDAGTVFELQPPSNKGGVWSESILWNFGNTSDGNEPIGGLVMDASGNLYGTTSNAGAHNGGTAFKLAPPLTNGGSWSESILWNFGADRNDGFSPFAGLIMDVSGNLYGTTNVGGTYGDGTVFEISTQVSTTPTPTATPTATRTVVSTMIATRTPTPTATATRIATATPTATSTPTLVTTLGAAPSTLSFGNVYPTGTSAAKKVTLSNKGKFAAQITTVTTPAPFMVAGSPNTCTGSTIAPKKTCVFDIEFAPTTVANAGGGSIDVSYNGLSPKVTLVGNGIAVTLNAPSRETFSSVAAGSDGKPKTIRISNPATVSVDLGITSIGGTDPGAFKIMANTCTGTLARKPGSCAISIEFTPGGGATGMQSATVELRYTYGANEGSVSIPISGTVK